MEDGGGTAVEEGANGTAAPSGKLNEEAVVADVDVTVALDVLQPDGFACGVGVVQELDLLLEQVVDGPSAVPQLGEALGDEGAERSGGADLQLLGVAGAAVDREKAHHHPLAAAVELNGGRGVVDADLELGAALGCEPGLDPAQVADGAEDFVPYVGAELVGTLLGGEGIRIEQHDLQDRTPADRGAAASANRWAVSPEIMVEVVSRMQTMSPVWATLSQKET
ncbi:hypothetical protein ACFQ0T_39435 [Kitasatospora gansuensis]